MSHDGAPVYAALFAAHAFLLGPHRTYRSFRSHAADALTAVWPYALETAAFLMVRFWVLGFISRPFPRLHLTAMETVLTIPRAIADYAMLLAVPWMAGPQHRLDPVQSVAAPAFLLPAAGVVALSGAAWLLLRHHSHRRLYLFCAAWTFIALAPTLNLSTLFAGTLLHDRYLYLPAFGWCVMVADLAVVYARASERRTRAAGIAAAAVAVVYAVALFPVQYAWHDDVTLFTRSIEVTPDVELFHNRLGTALKVRGDLAGARRELETAVKLEPEAGGSLLYELALVYEALGDRQAAARTMADGLKRIKYPPASGYTQLALIADAAGDTNGAEAALTRAAELPGGAQAAVLARAQIRLLHGDSKGALDGLHELVDRDPDNAEALASLGLALSSEHRYDEALTALRRAASIRPQAPAFHYLIASTLHQMGREAEARDECGIALAAAPNDPNTRALMAAIERSSAAR